MVSNPPSHQGHPTMDHRCQGALTHRSHQPPESQVLKPQVLRVSKPHVPQPLTTRLTGAKVIKPPSHYHHGDWITDPPTTKATVTGAKATKLTSHPGAWLTRTIDRRLTGAPSTSHQAHRLTGAKATEPPAPWSVILPPYHFQTSKTPACHLVSILWLWLYRLSTHLCFGCVIGSIG